MYWPTLKDVLSFAGGSAILFHQTAIATHAQTILVGAALGLIFGAPVVLRVMDRWSGNGRGPGGGGGDDDRA